MIAKRPIADSLWRKLTRADLRKYPHYDACQDRPQRLHYEILPGERAHELALRFTLGAQIHMAIVEARNPSHLLRNVQCAAAGALPYYQLEEIVPVGKRLQRQPGSDKRNSRLVARGASDKERSEKRKIKVKTRSVITVVR